MIYITVLNVQRYIKISETESGTRENFSGHARRGFPSAGGVPDTRSSAQPAAIPGELPEGAKPEFGERVPRRQFPENCHGRVMRMNSSTVMTCIVPFLVMASEKTSSQSSPDGSGYSSFHGSPPKVTTPHPRSVSTT